MSSGHNKRFLASPTKYLAEVVIIPNDGKFNGRTAREAMVHFRGGVNPANLSYDQIYLDLVPIDGGLFSSTTKVRADFSTVPVGGDDQIVGGYVPYILEGTVNDDPTKMGVHDLPAGGVPKFEFTGSMNGCSLILCTRTATGAKVAAHYPNSKGSTLGYPHLATLGLTHVKSIDYFNTGGGRGLQKNYSGLQIGGDYDAAAEALGNRAGWFNTFAFMMNIAGVWHLIAQPQFCEMQQDGSTTARRNGDHVMI